MKCVKKSYCCIKVWFIMKKLYIFDLDGTLVNSIYDLADSMNAVLEHHGFPTHDTEKYKYFVGNGTLKLVERAVPESEKNEIKIKALHAEFSEEYNKRCIDKTKSYDGIENVIIELHKRGCLTAVASNKPDQFVKFIVDSVFENRLFDEIAGKKENVPTKPDPEIVFGIMGKLGSDNDNTIMIGDSNVDVETAHNAGIKCIGCSWGFRGREELASAGADFIADKPSEILDFK